MLLLGADSAATLSSWKNADYLMDFPRIVYPRKGTDLEKKHNDIVLQNVTLQEISATQIRSERDKDVLKNWLPDAVFAYAQTHSLFNGI